MDLDVYGRDKEKVNFNWIFGHGNPGRLRFQDILEKDGM